MSMKKPNVVCRARANAKMVHRNMYLKQSRSTPDSSLFRVSFRALPDFHPVAVDCNYRATILESLNILSALPIGIPTCAIHPFPSQQRLRSDRHAGAGLIPVHRPSQLQTGDKRLPKQRTRDRQWTRPTILQTPR